VQAGLGAAIGRVDFGDQIRRLSLHYREKRRREVTLFSRQPEVLKGAFPASWALFSLAGDFVLDGRTGRLDPRGTTSFQASAKQPVPVPPSIYCFDLLNREGKKLGEPADREARELLHKMFAALDPLIFSAVHSARTDPPRQCASSAWKESSAHRIEFAIRTESDWRLDQSSAL
jgi:ATP-dependent DNA ligase